MKSAKAKGSNNSGKTASKVFTILYFVLLAVLLFFGIVGRSLSDWLKETFHTSFREIIYTYKLGLEGADVEFFGGAFQKSLVWIIAYILLLVIFIAVDSVMSRRIRNAEKKDEPTHMHAVRFLYRTVIIAVSAALALNSFLYADKLLKVSDFIKLRYVYSDLYENEYVDFDDVKVSGNENKRNVIIVYLESMESTYTSDEEGGPQEVNLLPKLTELARENVSFGDRKSENELRGTHNPVGTTWTTASILASSSGIPFAFQIGKNQMGVQSEEFAPDMTMLGDFLKKEGYYQEFMCGSESEFGGKKLFFESHGDYEIYDYDTAVKNGDIPEDYRVWWGLEDHRLYEMAKKELTRISAQDKPFNFTLLTVDTHHVGGYKCKWCGSKHKNPTADVVACADRQASDFIEWCKEQPFYQNTTIIMLGDHPRMDRTLVKKEKNQFNRCAYNCFINPVINGTSAVDAQAMGIDQRTQVDQNRLATTMDLFPTILSSMGYSIEGERLGLGTNLFSDEKTLAEKMTYEKFDDELGKNSHYYQEHFG